MAKIPSWQHYPGDWMKDPGLRSCCLAARGLWAEVLNLTWECPNRGILARADGRPWTDAELARAVGSSAATVKRLKSELIDKEVCGVTEQGAIYSRRQVRDELLRVANNNRQATLRENRRLSEKRNASVTPLSQPSSSSTSVLSIPSIESTSVTPMSAPVTTTAPADPKVSSPEVVPDGIDQKIFDTSRQDLSTGRYPLRKYAHIWLHDWELRDAREQWRAAGLSQDEWRNGLKITNVSMESKKHRADYRGGLAFKYLTTHILTDALDQKGKRNRANGITPAPEPAKPKAHRVNRTPRASSEPERVGFILPLVAVDRSNDDESGGGSTQ